MLLSLSHDISESQLIPALNSTSKWQVLAQTKGIEFWVPQDRPKKSGGCGSDFGVGVKGHAIWA